LEGYVFTLYVSKANIRFCRLIVSAFVGFSSAKKFSDESKITGVLNFNYERSYFEILREVVSMSGFRRVNQYAIDYLERRINYRAA